jgi:hypothetical protein
MRVQLETDVPVFSGVLTPHHFHEHEEHRSYFSQHFVTKGKGTGRRSRLNSHIIGVPISPTRLGGYGNKRCRPGQRSNSSQFSSAHVEMTAGSGPPGSGQAATTR